MPTTYTGLVDDETETVCDECGWTYTGTDCDVCTPCDDCGLIPALCECVAYSLDPIDD